MQFVLKKQLIHRWQTPTHSSLNALALSKTHILNLAWQTGVWSVVRAGTVGNTRVRIFQQSQGKGLGLGIRRGRRQELSPISGVKKNELSRRVNLALVIAVGFDAALKAGDCKHPRQLFTTFRTPSEETLANPRVCNFNFCYISSLPRVLPSKMICRHW